MNLNTVIWDFDGTILPSDPYDSEQTLLFYKINELREKISFFKQIVARAIIYADMKEWLGGSFKKYYVWVLRGTRIETLDSVAEHLARKISKRDRQTFFRLKEDGCIMIILSCGTVDLIERIVKLAGLNCCFRVISGNRFKVINGRISGMECHTLSPQDKLKVVAEMGISLEQAIVIGDGYTDHPILDRAGIPVMIDRTGKKREKCAKKNYYFISSIPELYEIAKKNLEMAI